MRAHHFTCCSLLGLGLLALIVPPGLAQHDPSTVSQVVWNIDLPASEEQVVRRNTYTRDMLTTTSGLTAVVQIRGPGPILLEAAVLGPGCEAKPLHLSLGNTVYENGHWNNMPLGRNSFSRLYTTDAAGYDHAISFDMVFADGSRLYLLNDDRRARPNAPEKCTCEFIVRVSRDLGACTMWASTRGDVAQEAHGSVAYFNTFKSGVPITTGTVADPGMHQELDGFMQFAEGMRKLAEDMGYEVPTDDNGNPSGDSGAGGSGSTAQMRAEMFAEGGDKFGLTLADVSAKAAFEKSGDSSALELLQGLDVFAGSFTLEASAPGSVEILENPEVSINLGTGSGSLVTIPLSSLRVVPGGLSGKLNRIPFIYRQGMGSAILTIEAVDKDFIMGQIGGELYTEALYDGRRASITVAATFAARRGFKSCMR